MTAYKKLIALALVCVTTLSLTACGNADTTWVMADGEEKVPAGIYLYNLMSAHSEAGGLVEDAEKDILSQQVEGKDASTWISETASLYTKEFIAINRAFAERGLSLTEEEKTSALSMADYQWEYLEEDFTKNGISKSSLDLLMENSMKRATLFNTIYGTGGEKAVPREELVAKYEADYTRSQYIAISKKDGEGATLPQDKLDAAKAEMDGYATRAKAGDKFVDLILEYEKAHTPEGQEPHAHEGEGVHESVIAKTSTSFPQKYLEEVFAMAVNTPTQFEDDSYYYLVVRLDLMGDGKDFEQRMDSLLYDVKGEEFNQTVTGWAQALEGITLNDAALERYTPKDLKFQ